MVIAVVGLWLVGAPIGAGVASAVSATAPQSTSAPGYWLLGADGGVFAFGAPFFGNPQTRGPNICMAPVASNPWVCRSIAATSSGDGYWIVSSEDFEGGISAMVAGFGDASLPQNPAPLSGLNDLIVGAATTAGGLLLAGADGGVFAYGTAPFFGSLAGTRLGGPIVAITTNPNVNGYWLTGSDGAVHPFGGAGTFGDMAQRSLNQPIVAMTTTPDGQGYWLTAADGGVFAFGDAPFLGSMAGQHLNAPVTGIATTPDGHGYWLTAADGGVFAFGDAPFLGSMAGQHLNAAIDGASAG
jgi:hypothetical protein